MVCLLFVPGLTAEQNKQSIFCFVGVTNWQTNNRSEFYCPSLLNKITTNSMFGPP